MGSNFEISKTDLTLLGGDGGVPVDEPGEDSAQGLDAEREGRDVEEEHVGDVPREDTSLDGSPYRHSFVRIHRVARGTTEYLLHRLLDLKRREL